MQSEEAPPPKWRIEVFEKAKHDRGSFDCGTPVLNEYLKTRASQDVKANLAVLWVATSVADTANPKKIVGFYTISMSAVRLQAVPEEQRKALARYPNVPVTHLGRMAVATDLQGQGLGKRLLAHCMYRVKDTAEKIACVGMDVIAKDEKAKNFYLRMGFKMLLDEEKHLFLPISVIKQLPPEVLQPK